MLLIRSNAGLPETMTDLSLSGTSGIPFSDGFES